MKLFIIIVISFQTILASSDWEQFKTKYGKVYENQDEELHRQQIFLKNIHLIKEHNKKYEQGLFTYTVQINKFADLSENEMLSASKAVPKPINKVLNYKISPTEEVPDSIDWRDYGVISPIADQKGCDTCWAFAIVGTIEAHWAIYKGENISLSQQNLADCVDPNFTCSTRLQDGIFERTYQYIIDNGGIDTLESYPYDYFNTGNCQFSAENIGATIKDYANTTTGDEEELKRIVGTVGPVTVAISTTTNWNIYRDGIFYDDQCNELDFLNHAVVVVGYGTQDGQDYWIVKNEWGTWYGKDGYIKMARNRNNHCGIASIARYPIL